MVLVPPGSYRGIVVLGASAVGWSHTGDTNEAPLVAVTIPANTIGLGVLEVISLWSMTNNANTKTPAVKLSTTGGITGTTIVASGFASVPGWQSYARWANRATNSQIGFTTSAFTSYATSGGANATGALDTTAQLFVNFTGKCNTSGTDTITLESYIVRVLPPGGGLL